MRGFLIAIRAPVASARDTPTDPPPASASLGGTVIESSPLEQERKSAGEVLVVKEAPSLYHRAYLAGDVGSDEPTGACRRNPGSEQAIERGADLRRRSGVDLKSDKAPHSPFAAKPAIESRFRLRWLGVSPNHPAQLQASQMKAHGWAEFRGLLGDWSALLDGRRRGRRRRITRFLHRGRTGSLDGER
jgi:hypothetical protein